jgi:hypothetical protein
MKTILTALALTLPCHAAVSFTLPGSSESAAWTGLKGSNYTSAAGFPSYPTATNPWPNALTPDSVSMLDSEFNKVSGGGYFASSSIYDSGIPGTFRMTSLTAIANLETVVMQADVGALLGGAPVLSYNGGTQQLVADFSGNSAGNFVANNFDGSTTPSTNQAWQWDLSGLGETITEYSVEWSTAAHGTIYEVNLAEGNSFAQVVPEPSLTLLALLSSSLLFRRRRDR